MTPEKIENIIAAYLEAKQEESDAKKRKDALAALILAHAGVTKPEQTAYFETAGFRVDITPRKRDDIDRKKLQTDFPDIMAEYGKTSRWSQIDAREKLATEAIPASA